MSKTVALLRLPSFDKAIGISEGGKKVPNFRYEGCYSQESGAH